MPLLLGEGTRLFEHPGGTAVKLQPMSATPAQNATHLWFRVIARPGREPQPRL